MMQEAYEAFWVTVEIGADHAQPQLAQKIEGSWTKQMHKKPLRNPIFPRFLVNTQLKVQQPNSKGFIIDLE